MDTGVAQVQFRRAHIGLGALQFAQPRLRSSLSIDHLLRRNLRFLHLCPTLVHEVQRCGDPLFKREDVGTVGFQCLRRRKRFRLARVVFQVEEASKETTLSWLPAEP